MNLRLEDRMENFNTMMKDNVSSEFFKWLDFKGFFTAPASKNHHGNYQGGLFDHSYEVARTLYELTEFNNLTWKRKRSPLIVGMFHDLCKIDNYRWVVDDPGTELFGGEIRNRTYKIEYNDEYLIDGHGDKSVMYLAQHMQLTEEEILCIRWHMGAFDDKQNWKLYSAAVKKYPNVLWTHTADMIASQIMGV